MKTILISILILASSATFASTTELFKCPVVVNGNAGDVEFPQKGDVITHTVTNGNETTAAITVTFGKTLQMEEHLKFQNGKLVEFFQFRPAPPFGNKEYKWMHMTIDRSSGKAVPAVWVIRAKAVENFDEWIGKATDPALIAKLKLQKAFFVKYYLGGVSDITKSVPMKADWLADMKPEISDNRTHDQSPNPFTEDLKDGFYTLFVDLKNQSKPALQQQYNFFTISKDQQIWPTKIKGKVDRNSVDWESTLKIGTDIDLDMRIDHVAHVIQNFNLKAGAFGSWVEAKNETGCQKL